MDRFARLLEAEYRLNLFASCRQHYDFGTMEYQQAKLCSRKAAEIHGSLNFLLNSKFGIRVAK